MSHLDGTSKSLTSIGRCKRQVQGSSDFIGCHFAKPLQKIKTYTPIYDVYPSAEYQTFIGIKRSQFLKSHLSDQNRLNQLLFC